MSYEWGMRMGASKEATLHHQKHLIIGACLLALGVSGCSSVPDYANPVEWYNDVSDFFGDEGEEGPPLASDNGEPYPNLGQVPDRPSATAQEQRQALESGLAAPNQAGDYTSQDLRAEVAPAPAPSVTPVQSANSGIQPLFGGGSAQRVEVSPPAAQPLPQVQQVQPPAGSVTQQQLSPPPSFATGRPGAPAPQIAVPQTSPAQIAQASGLPAAPPPVVVSQGSVTVPQVVAPQMSQIAPVPQFPVGQAIAPAPTAIGTGAPMGAMPSVPAYAQRFTRAPAPAAMQNLPPLRPVMPTLPIYQGPQTTMYAVPGYQPAPLALRSGPTLTPASMTPALQGVAGQRLGTIYFNHGSANLDRHDRSILKQVSDLYRQYGGGVLTVVGHASHPTKFGNNHGGELVNHKISSDRARAVRLQLRRYGVPDGALKVTAFGDNQPEYLETAKTGEAGNRRVVIFWSQQ